MGDILGVLDQQAHESPTEAGGSSSCTERRDGADGGSESEARISATTKNREESRRRARADGAHEARARGSVGTACAGIQAEVGADCSRIIAHRSAFLIFQFDQCF